MPQSLGVRKQTGQAVGGQKVEALAKSALGELNAALQLRDPSIASRFHKSALFVGSEPGEFARGRGAIAALLERIFASAATVQFEWASVEASRSGDSLWFFADGSAVIAASGDVCRRPYRLTGVLGRTRRGWRWRLFHGSEPWIDPAAGLAQANRDRP